MRAPGAYMPDIINYTYDVDVYVYLGRYADSR